jgi:hypothetical protein
MYKLTGGTRESTSFEETQTQKHTNKTHDETFVKGKTFQLVLKFALLMKNIKVHIPHRRH